MRIARYLKIQLLALDQHFLVPFFSRHPWLASLYYVVVSRKFGREHKAVLSGRNRYYASLRDPADTSFLLRRNTHRLEKGLIMRPRRDVFALDYIEETVNQYAVCKELSAVTETELQWVHDVLSITSPALARPRPSTKHERSSSNVKVTLRRISHGFLMKAMHARRFRQITKPFLSCADEDGRFVGMTIAQCHEIYSSKRSRQQLRRRVRAIASPFDSQFLIILRMQQR